MQLRQSSGQCLCCCLGAHLRDILFRTFDAADMKRIALGRRSILALCQTVLPRGSLNRIEPSAPPTTYLIHAKSPPPFTRFTSTKASPTRTPPAASPTAKPPAAVLPPFVSFLSTSIVDTHVLAAELAALCGPGDVLLLFGKVGEGKTELARGFLRSYTGVSDLIVTSPTYTVMLEYAHKRHRSDRTCELENCCLPSSVPSKATDVSAGMAG